MLSRPPQILLTASSKLRANHLLEGSRVPQFLENLNEKYSRKPLNYRRPEEEDRLFEAAYDHVLSTGTCQLCDTSKIVSRLERDDDSPAIHYGLIASGNKLIKGEILRERLSQESGIHCVDMEAAGLINNFPCLVVRGICNYADSHKNDAWNGYTSAAAAAYAKDLLLVTTIAHAESKPTTSEGLSDLGMVPCGDLIPNRSNLD